MATAALTGTATTAPFRGANIVSGGFTLIITLTGDTWVASGATFNAQRQNIINGMTSAGSETHGWNNEVKAKIAVTDVVRTSNTVVTITLDAEAAFSITATEVVTITIPSTAVAGAVAIVVSPTLLIIPSPFTFYVRKIGSDSNSGTTASAAWLTLNHALSSTGISSGDTVYIGAGVYRETVTVGMTSATAETKILGDVDGSKTGDTGEVQWTAYLTGDAATPSSTTLLNLNGKSFLTFQNIVYQFGNNTGITATTTTSHDIKFIKCLLNGNGNSYAALNITPAVDVALNWVIDSCSMLVAANVIFINAVRPSAADLDLNFVIKNCFVFGVASNFADCTLNGANTFNPGGVIVYSCSFIGISSIITTPTNYSTTIPCKGYNNFMICGNPSKFSAATLGQIIEDYNCGVFSRTNVAIGAHSITDGSYAPLFFTGHEYYSVGANLMPFGMPKPGSPLLGFGNQSGSPSTDILGVNRPEGLIKLATGTATSGAAKTITDSGQTWGTNSFAGMTIKIISGTGSGQTKTIPSNTATVITVDGNWKTNPDNTSVYEVYLRATSSSGTATAGTTTTLTDSNAAWGVNMWAGYTLLIDGGTGSPQTLVVVSNTATALTFAAATAPDNTSTYKLYRGTNENTINSGVGCYEYGQSAVKETSTVRTGSNAIRIAGAGYYDFIIPVSAASTTITVYAQYDAAYSGTLPSMNIINGTECGVANATATQAGSSGSWEQLSLTFTPTSTGIITVRLIAASTTPTGNGYFDDFNVV